MIEIDKPCVDHRCDGPQVCPCCGACTSLCAYAECPTCDTDMRAGEKRETACVVVTINRIEEQG